MESEKEIQAIIDLMIKDQNFRRTLARQSLRLFFGTYFNHYIKYAFAPFHMEMFRLAEDENNKTIVIMGARNSAKSAIMNTALAIWSVLGVPQKKYVVIASRTQVKAKQHFMNVRTELESNILLAGDMGPFKAEEFPWGSIIILPKYDAKIIFMSVEQSLRGERYKQYRPDLVIADDIEDSSSVKTIDGRNQTYDWLVQDVIPGGDLENLRIVLLGTLLHEDSVMMRFKKDIEAGNRGGIYREYPLMDASGTVLWKGKYPDAATVERERLMIGNDKAWAQEFLLRIVSGNERVIHPEWIHYGECPQPTLENKYRGAFIGIDPAISKEEGAACTAMVVVRVFGWGEDMKIYVLPYPVNDHLDFPETLGRVRALASTYGDKGRIKIYVEDVGYQKALVQALIDQKYDTIGVRPQGDKKARLVLISHHIKNGTVQFASRGNEELIMQIVNFGNEKYMDLADALSLIVPEVINTQQGYQPFPNQEMEKIPKGEEPYNYDPDVGSVFSSVKGKMF